tara:strand:- start:218 stop:760 length:543 start_codon:yes stop_codon:yes gene_type:complete
VTNFFLNYNKSLIKNINSVNISELVKIAKLIISIRKKNKKIILLGNGGSAAIASHVSVDLTKAGNIRSINFNEADLITCLANDFGYENWMAKAINYYAKNNDLLIIISSSGKSKNIINAIKAAKKLKMKVVTLTGFSKNNPVKKLGNLNLWVNSNKYNIVETTHQTWLLSIIDYIIENNL